MDEKLLQKILSLPSYSGQEGIIKNFLIEYAIANNLYYETDSYENLFLVKGDINSNEYFPCVVAHMDTVHSDQIDMVINQEQLIINETILHGDKILYAHRLNEFNQKVNTGCGGDDKAGVFICLELLKNFDNIICAFFVEEEIGCLGSRNAQNNDLLKRVGYFIQFDAPTDNWITKVCSGVTLFNDNIEKLLNDMWINYDLSLSMNDPFTDVKYLRLNYGVSCINYFAGYMNMHSEYEYVVLNFVEKAINVGIDTIKILGNDKYV